MDLKDMLKEVVVPGVIAMSLIGTACYLAVVGQTVPEWLLGVAGTAVGYYFNYAAASQARRV